MSLLELAAIAVSLSLDAFAVALCMGCALTQLSAGHYLRLSAAFGGFQFAMPVAGWYLGNTIHGFIEEWDHWLAFALLAWVGVSMLRSALTRQDQRMAECSLEVQSHEIEAHHPPEYDPTLGATLLLLAVGTSIDALAVGLTFSLINEGIWLPAISIGIVCAGFTAMGLYLGGRLRHTPGLGRWATFAGGIVLIGIGMKILFQHGALG